LEGFLFLFLRGSLYVIEIGNGRGIGWIKLQEMLEILQSWACGSTPEQKEKTEIVNRC
jgi:hypothetical protein